MRVPMERSNESPVFGDVTVHGHEIFGVYFLSLSMLMGIYAMPGQAH